jgi:phospholipase C
MGVLVAAGGASAAKRRSTMATISKPASYTGAVLAGVNRATMPSASLSEAVSSTIRHRTSSAAGSPIKHVVVIDMENHSFDNVLGFWCDHHLRRCPDGGMPTSVTLSDGTTVTPTTDPDTVPDVLHTVASQLAAMNIDGGVPQMNGWQNIPDGSCAASTNYQCVSGYQGWQVPNIRALAKNFAISDHTFSMGDSPSWGGHLYAVMGSLDDFTGDNPVAASGVTPGEGWGCDSNKVTPWISPGGPPPLPPAGTVEDIPSCIPDPNLGLPNGGAFEPTPAAYHATIMDELQQAGLSWKIYGPDAPSDGGYIWAVCPSIAECRYTHQATRLLEPSQFFTDASHGKLPSFSLVSAGGAGRLTLSSCHNKFSMTACDNYIGQLVSSVENGPAWLSTAIFITFDDFGGFYDQVPPPLNPDGTQEGPRLPLIIASPYARPGYTDTTSTSFAGILAYVEHNFGLAPLGVNDQSAYDFTNAFNYSQTPLKPIRLARRPLPASARHIHISAVGKDPS